MARDRRHRRGRLTRRRPGLLAEFVETVSKNDSAFIKFAKEIREQNLESFES